MLIILWSIGTDDGILYYGDEGIDYGITCHYDSSSEGNIGYEDIYEVPSQKSEQKPERDKRYSANNWSEYFIHPFIITLLIVGMKQPMPS